MANYTLTNQWQTLSDIMDSDYDNTKQYRIHNNVELPTKLCLTEESNPTDDIIGRVYPPFCEIYIEEGTNPYLRRTFAVGNAYIASIEISEV